MQGKAGYQALPDKIAHGMTPPACGAGGGDCATLNPQGETSRSERVDTRRPAPKDQARESGYFKEMV